MKLRFEIPSLEHAADVEAFLQELHEDEPIHGASKIRTMPYAQWVKRTEVIASGNHLPEGYVRASTFFVYDDTLLIGFANLRLELNQALLDGSGHLGYMIRKSQRRKGYAKALVLKALDYYHEHFGLDKILITVDTDNTPSRKVLESLGASYYRSVPEGDKFLDQYYLNRKTNDLN